MILRCKSLSHIKAYDQILISIIICLGNLHNKSKIAYSIAVKMCLNLQALNQ